jgi:hypothetical protein
MALVRERTIPTELSLNTYSQPTQDLFIPIIIIIIIIIISIIIILVITFMQGI